LRSSYGGCRIGILRILCAWTIWQGIGSWNLNRTIGWGWDITNFVWWVGIGHAGTLISAILAAVPPEVAYRGKPGGGGDDDLCRYVCGAVPLDSHGAFVAGPFSFSLIQYPWTIVGEL
jgi:hypothetical protein